jgi:hypothetical protein
MFEGNSKKVDKKDSDVTVSHFIRFTTSRLATNKKAKKIYCGFSAIRKQLEIMNHLFLLFRNE